jgi:hypothetical protein
MRMCLPLGLLAMLGGCGASADRLGTDGGVDALPSGPVAGGMLAAAPDLLLLPDAIDDWLFAIDHNQVRGFPPDGSDPVDIGPPSMKAEVRGHMLFFTDLSGALRAWTPQSGVVQLSSASVDGLRLSYDGTSAAWMENGDFVVSTVDGQHRTVAVSQPQSGTGACYLSYTGCGGARFCLSHCPSGAQDATITMADAQTGTVTDLRSGVTGWGPDNGVILTMEASGQWLVPTDGRPALPANDVDARETWLPDETASAVFYTNASRLLQRVALSPGATAAELQPDTLRQLVSLVPDGKRAISCSNKLFAVARGGGATVIDSTFKNLGYLLFGGAPGFSPDFSTTYYIGAANELRAAPMDGSGARTVVAMAQGYWPLDGGRLLVAIGSQTSFDLEILGADDQVESVLVKAAQAATPSARRVGWLVTQDGQTQLWAAPYQGMP